MLRPSFPARYASGRFATRRDPPLHQAPAGRQLMVSEPWWPRRRGDDPGRDREDPWPGAAAMTGCRPAAGQPNGWPRTGSARAARPRRLIAAGPGLHRRRSGSTTSAARSSTARPWSWPTPPRRRRRTTSPSSSTSRPGVVSSQPEPGQIPAVRLLTKQSPVGLEQGHPRPRQPQPAAGAAGHGFAGAVDPVRGRGPGQGADRAGVQARQGVPGRRDGRADRAEDEPAAPRPGAGRPQAAAPPRSS